jgi:phage repressor protein C with HTH and peptisase S24 domain
MPKNTTFQERLLMFIEHLGLKPTSFEAEMGFSNGSIGKVLNGNRSVSSDRLETIVYKYPSLDIDWLLTGRGKMIKSYSSFTEQSLMVSEPALTYDKSGNEMIPIADIKAAAGNGYINEQVLRNTDFVQLPANLVKSGKHMCVRIKGNSMSPTLQDGGFVIIRLLEKSEWTNLVSDRVYIVSDTEGMTYLKRVRNRFTSGGFIVLTSDNPDKATYPNFNLQQNELVSIWYVEWYLSAKLPNIHDQFYSRLERLENSIEDINRKFEDLENVELNPRIK